MEHDIDFGNLAWFAGWAAALGVLFWLALGLPLQTRLARLGQRIYTAGVVVAVVAVLTLANFALSLHDVHLDLTREKVFTPSPRAQAVVDALDRPVQLTYFYQDQDPNGKRAKEIVETMGRRNRLLHVRTVDPDKQPTMAQNYGIKEYNAAILESGGRRIVVRSVDESDIAIGIQRVLRQIVVNICFIEGQASTRSTIMNSTPTWKAPSATPTTSRHRR